MKTTVFAIFIALVSFSSTKVKAQSSDVENKKLNLYDKFAYKTAAEMYAVADTMPYSTEADLLITEISNKIAQGLFVENEAIWDNLQKLEPYRMHHRVQEAVKIWVDKSAKKISSQKSATQTTLASLQSVSQAYNSRDFEKAIQECKNILQGSPKHLDVRSNMALALIHLNKDLCAQIELEIVLKLSDKHIPAMLNLTVAYERLNKHQDAEDVLAKLLQLSENNKLNNPMIRYNAAWFRFQDGNYSYADTLLNRPKH